MTEHNHTTLVEGCFRCDLNKDEIDAITADQDRALAAVMRRMIEGKILRPMQVEGGHMLALPLQAPVFLMALDYEEWDLLTDVQDFDEVPHE